MSRYAVVALAVALCALTSSAALAAGEKTELLKPHDAHGVKGEISLDKSEYSVGDWMKATVTIGCQYNSRRLYNPMFNRLLEVPGRLRVFDKNGKLVWQYFESHGGSRREPGEMDWVLLYDSSFIGSTSRLPLCGWFADKSFPPAGEYPPGEYRMQLVLTKALEIGEEPPSGAGNPSDIIAASEPVSFRITAPRTSKPNTAAPDKSARQ